MAISLKILRKAGLMSKKVENKIVCSIQENTSIVPHIISTENIVKPNCKLCQSDLREKAEEIYDNQTKRKNYSLIQRKLKDENDFDISANSVRNHMLYHHNVVENNDSLQDYAGDIQKWINVRTNTLSSIKARRGLLEREMFTIGHMSEDADLIERRKSAETIKKLADSILLLETKEKEFKEDSEPITLIFNQLQVIVNDELQHVDSIKTKQILSTVLSRLKDSVGEMMIE